MNERRYPPRTTIVAFLTSAALSMTMLAARTDRATAEPTFTRRVVQVEHIKIDAPKKFADVEAAFKGSLPKLDPAMIKAMAAGDEQRVTELEQGQPLFIFCGATTGRSCRLSADPARRCNMTSAIRTPLQKMTRYRLSAGLYAPLCVLLYEDDNGDTVFEYDKPSSLFGQFNDDAVTAVARGLDDALERAIRRAFE
jgi:hypothetical protein